MIRPPPIAQRTDTLLPNPTLFRSLTKPKTAPGRKAITRVRRLNIRSAATRPKRIHCSWRPSIQVSSTSVKPLPWGDEETHPLSSPERTSAAPDASTARGIRRAPGAPEARCPRPDRRPTSAARVRHKIGRTHVLTHVNNAQLVCRLL